MKTTTILVLLALLAAAPAAAQDAAEEAGGLAISAFADVQMPVESRDDDDGRFNINQAEIDLEGTIHPKTTAAMAVAWDPEAETFALAVLAAEYALAEGDDFSAALMAGQFDVRFGVDWRVYASIDRRLVTAPLTTDGTHEGWNDQGVNLNLAMGSLGADLFVLNGSGCGRGVQTAKIDRTDVRRAFGGRVGGLFGAFEAGASGAACHDYDGNLVTTLLGVDLQAAFGPLALRGEYIMQDVDQNTTAATKADGWYLQGIYDFGSGFAFARWDGLDPEAEGADKPERWSLGGGWILGDGLELRLEHEVGVSALPNRTVLQLAFSFGEIGG